MADKSLATFHLVYIDDSADDREFIRLAVLEELPAAQLTALRDFSEAEAYVAAVAGLRATPPDLFLVDCHLGGYSGATLVRTIRAVPALVSTPVCIFTSSDDPGDVALCYAAGADGYLTKPRNFATYRRIVRALRGLTGSVAERCIIRLVPGYCDRPPDPTDSANPAD